MKRNFTKFLINNIYDKKYLKNINRVHFDKQKTDANNILDDEQIKNRMDEIEEYQIKYRHNNFNCLKDAMVELRTIQFWGVLVPVTLIASTVTSFILPYQKFKTKKYEAYQKESTILSEEGKITELGDYYYDTSDEIIDPNFLDTENNHYAYSLPNDLEYRISNGIDTALANFELDDNGQLIFNNVEVGKYVGETDYDFTNGEEIDKEYQKLFDDIYELIKSEGNLDENQLAALEDIYNSEDREIIIEIAKSISIGEKEVEIVKTRLLSRILLLFVTIFYIAIEIAVLKEKDFNDEYVIDFQDGYEIDFQDGYLSIEESENEPKYHYNLLRQSLRYKEAFIRAEVERISRAKELADEYIEEQDKEEIFTRFERKLKI